MARTKQKTVRRAHMTRRATTAQKPPPQALRFVSAVPCQAEAGHQGQDAVESASTQ